MCPTTTEPRLLASRIMQQHWIGNRHVSMPHQAGDVEQLSCEFPHVSQFNEGDDRNEIVISLPGFNFVHRFVFPTNSNLPIPKPWPLNLTTIDVEDPKGSWPFGNLPPTL